MIDSNKRSAAVRDIGKAFGLAINFIASVIVLTVIGWLVDRWQNTAPTFLLVGLGVGLVVGFWQFVREAIKMGGRPAGKSPPAAPRPTAPTEPDTRRRDVQDRPESASPPPPERP